jgi:hypothetical protein
VYLLRDEAVMVFGSIQVHYEQVTCFDLVEVVEFKQPLEISYNNLLWCFDVDVDKTADKPAEVISVKRVPFDEVVDYFQGVICDIEVPDDF